MKTAVLGVGGLGHLAVKFFAKMGHECTGVTTSMDKAEFIKSLGATDVLVMSDEERVKEHLGQYDLIINTLPVAGDLDKYLKLVAPCGTIVQVGLPEFSDKINISVYLPVLNEINIVGSLVGSRKTIQEMLQFCADNDLYPIVEEYKFENFDKALDRMENGKPIFRCVVNCGDYSKTRGLQKF